MKGENIRNVEYFLLCKLIRRRLEEGLGLETFAASNDGPKETKPEEVQEGAAVLMSHNGGVKK